VVNIERLRTEGDRDEIRMISTRKGAVVYRVSYYINADDPIGGHANQIGALVTDMLDHSTLFWEGKS